MKKMGDMLLRHDAFSEIVMGNTAIVRAMVEAGTRVVSSYPGSPTPEIASAIQSIPKDDRPFYFEFSTNEKVATELAYGAAVNGHLSTVFFKSVGLNVAADTFVQLSLMNIIGGMVVVLGDDPGANSSQNEQDNRHYAHDELHPGTRTGRSGRSLPILSRSRPPVPTTSHAGNPAADHPRLPRQGKGGLRPLESGSNRRTTPPDSILPTALTFRSRILAIEQKRTALARLEQVRQQAEKAELNRVVDQRQPRAGCHHNGIALSVADGSVETA
jgi:indolepyruvate ferredoxin oxidoreductase alpha subunit